MNDTTATKIAELRAKGLFRGWSDERVASNLRRTAGLHAKIAAASERFGNAEQAKAASAANRRMVRDFGLNG